LGRGQLSVLKFPPPAGGALKQEGVGEGVQQRIGRAKLPGLKGIFDEMREFIIVSG